MHLTIDDRCVTPLADRQKLAFMVKAFDKIMTQLNVTHWIDYGTLMGAMRYGNIIAWDHDADVAFDWKFEYLLREGGIAQKIAKEQYNIFLNSSHLLYSGKQVDIFSFDKIQLPNGDFIYTKAENRNAEFWELLFNDFNASFVKKTVLVPFAGEMVHAPYSTLEFLKKRYPTSYNRRTPFKVSCYLPWNIPLWLFSDSVNSIKT